MGKKIGITAWICLTLALFPVFTVSAGELSSVIHLEKQTWMGFPGFSSDLTHIPPSDVRKYLEESRIEVKYFQSFPILITREWKSSNSDYSSYTLLTFFRIPEPQKENDVPSAPAIARNYILHFSGIGENFRVYLNGELIDDQLNEDKKIGEILSRRSKRNYRILLPGHILRNDNLLLIHLKGQNIPMSFFFNPEYGLFFRGDYFITSELHLPDNTIWDVSGFFFIVFFLLGIVFLIIYLGNKNENYNADFSALSFVFSLNALSQSSIFTIFTEMDTGIITYLEAVSVSLVPLLASRFIFSYWKLKIRPKSVPFFLDLLHWIMPAVVVFIPYSMIHFMVQLTVLYYIPLTIYLGFFVFVHISLGKKTARRLLAVIIIYFLFLSLHILDYFCTRSGNNYTYYGFMLIAFFLLYSFSEKFRFQKIKNEALKEYYLQVNQAYSRFIPHEFFRFLRKKDILDVKLGDQIEKEMTILFSDIRSFTQLSYRLTEEETFNLINEYLAYVVPVIKKHNGFIDKFIGDAIMALFPENSQDAVEAAIDMHKALEEFNKKSEIELKVGIGIHTGNLRLGIIGEKERMETTVISDAVNLASKIESLTKLYSSKILLSGNTFFNLDDPSLYHFRIITRTLVKGSDSPVGILEIFNNEDDVMVENKLKYKFIFEKAFADYVGRDFVAAYDQFSRIKNEFPEDKAVDIFLSRILEFKKNPPNDKWNGTEIVTG